MAGEEENTEYESDPEEAKMSLKMRRREASDDEDEEREREIERRRKIVDDSDGESDGQGAAAEYDDDEYDDEGEDEDEDEEEYYDERGEYVGEERGIGGAEDEFEEAEVVEREIGVESKAKAKAKAVGEGEEEEEGSQDAAGGEGEGEGGEGGEEKKENEPFAVPTSGAFYMHDDRFRDNAGGRHRRTFGGRKLWESKDERKWGHDKFEELNMDDRHYDEGRRPSRGSYRGRGKAKGTDRGNARGGRMRGYGGNSNQGAPPKDVRGRGPRRYQPSVKNRNEAPTSHNKQVAKSFDKNPHPGSRRVAATTASANADHEPVFSKKVASNLNSASPPFYPSGSSNKDPGLTQKKEVQAGNHNRNNRPSAVDNNFSMPHSNSLLRGKNFIDTMGMDKLHIDDSVSSANVKPLNSVHLPSAASALVGATQMSQSRPQGRGVASSGSAIYQPSQTTNQINKISPPAQASQRIPVQGRGQGSLQASGQQPVRRPLGGSQSSSPPKAGVLTNTMEPGNVDSQLESGKSKIAMAGKGQGSAQGNGRGSLTFGSSQAIGPGGNMGAGHSDPNLPAFFPVMQFGNQHPGGIGVPAVGMAFPGYVAQPNGLGNSEMTWLPVLASAAGALGATYCSPYLSVDGSYNPRPTGQTSALPAPSKDTNLSKLNNESKPQPRSDVTNDEYSQRQNKPRRYSEMNFSQ